MLEIFLKTLPFFAVIGLGYVSGRTRFFTEEATAYLTKFVFYFALSAMIFRFAASLELEQLLDWTFIKAYLAATATVYVIATGVSMLRGVSVAEAAVEVGVDRRDDAAEARGVGRVEVPQLGARAAVAHLVDEATGLTGVPVGGGQPKRGGRRLAPGSRVPCTTARSAPTATTADRRTSTPGRARARPTARPTQTRTRR